MKKDLQIYDELSDVITALTNPIAINSISELNGVSTINTSITIFDNLSDIILLTDGMIVTIDSINYPVSNVINTVLVKSFDVTATGLTADEWNVATNFQTGSRKEINEILDSESGNLDRFPLIWLLPETDLDGTHPVLDFTVTLNIVFAYKANNTDRTGKRITNNFKPVIQPLVTLFNKWIQSSDFNYMFEFFGYGKPIDSQYSNLPFFGNSDKTSGVITTTDTDAKQIEYNLSFKNQYFTTPVTVIPFPNPADLNTWHKTITNVDFAESINSLDAKFLPRIADFNGVDDYVETGIQLSGNVFDITLKGRKASGQVLTMAQGSTNLRTGILWFSDDKIYCLINNGVSIAYGVTSALTNFDYKIFRFVYDGTGVSDSDKLKLYIDGVYTAFSSFVGPIPSTVTPSATNLRIGQGYSASLYTKGVISYAKSLGQFEYHLTGQGDHEYDISGNNQHGTINGTGTHFDYDENGSIYPNTNGYSLWQLAGDDDIQAPFDVNGLPLSLTAGVDIPVGYTHSYDLLPSGINHNIYDSLINLNPTGSLNAALDIFDRSNVTIQTAISRASIYYDATDRTTSSIYHISEIIDPRVYDTFFNAAYKNTIFGKILMDGVNIIRYDEELNYITQREGAELMKNEIYCGFITNIYP